MFMNMKDRLPRYSLNGGVTWTEVATGAGFPVGMTPSVIALAPRLNNPQPVRLFIGVSGSDPSKVGIYRTGDFGSTWTFMTYPHPAACNTNDSFTNLTASPADPTRLYFNKYCEYYDGVLWLPYNIGYTSNDSGVVFTEIITDTAASMAVNVLQPSPVLTLRVFDGCSQVSDSAGVFWTNVNLSFPCSILVQDSQYAEKFYAEGYYGDGYYTANSGVSWNAWKSHPCPSSGLQLIADPAVSDTLYMLCSEGLFRSQNDGNDWVEISKWHGIWIGPDYSASPYRVIWARNDGLWASSDQGENWTHLTDGYTSSLFTGWENASPPDPIGTIKGFATLDVDNVWAISKSGDYSTTSHVLHWNGQEWDQVGIPITGTLNGISFDGPNNGWIVGGGLAMHWDGATWQSMAVPGDAILSKVDLSANQAWAVGNGGKILKAEGLSWSEVTGPTAVDLFTVAIVSQDDVWAGGGNYTDIPLHFNGVILHKNASGWSVVKTSDQYIINDISALASDNAWAVGSSIGLGQGAILHWDGNTWQEMQTPGHLLSSISMVSPDDGWIVCDDILLHWDGSSWSEAGSLGPGCCSGASAALNSDNVWLANGEYIVRYLNPRLTFLPFLSR
jgi:hypothetical protein